MTELSPQNSYVEVTLEVIVFGDRVFTMRLVSLNGVTGGAPIQSDWYPYKKGLECRLAERKDNVRIQGEDGHLQGKEASEETSP